MHRTDSYYEIGSSHLDCQDYSASNSEILNIHPEEEHFSVGMVSDGCSSSHAICGQTDIGARLITMSAMANRLEIYDDINTMRFEPEKKRYVGNMIAHDVLSDIDDYQRMMDLDPYAYDATLGIAAMTNDKALVVTFGDVDFVVKTDKSTIWYSVIFESGAPYYLNYMKNLDRKHAYEDQFSKYPVNVKRTVLEGDAEIGPICLSLGNTPEEIMKNNMFFFSGVESVTIFTDGIRSFFQNDNGKETPVPTETVIRELTNFKNLNGRFAVRRFKMFEKRVMKKNNWSHFDDLGFAVIHNSGNDQEKTS